MKTNFVHESSVEERIPKAPVTHISDGICSGDIKTKGGMQPFRISVDQTQL